MEEIKLQVAYGAVKHFGRNLYTSNPPAIAELVANSWDAYSEKCYIYYKDDSLLILDNGIGMTDDEFSNRYAISGTEKDTSVVRVPKDKVERPYMGRKGIGKFAAFSLGEDYTIFTKSDNDTKWKKVELKYSNLLVNEAIVSIPVSYTDDLSELSDVFGEIADVKQGTAIYIPEMKRKFIKSTQDNLEKILARRFSVNIAQKYTFSLELNGKVVDLSKHFYDNNLEFIYYFGHQKNEINARFPQLEDNNVFLVQDDYLNRNNVSGWIGTVEKPRDLWIEDDTSAYGVVVYINGKLADENILKTRLSARIANAYVIGEVSADFLQNTHEDPVLSSREGLNFEVESVEDLANAVFRIRSTIDQKWNELRASRQVEKQKYLKEIIDDSQWKTIYDSFNSDQKQRFHKLAQGLFDNNEDNNKGVINLYTPVLFSLVNSEIISDIAIDLDVDDLNSIAAKFYTLFDKVGINYAMRIKSNIYERLEIIDELKKAIDDEAIEKVFEDHLSANPWLINGYWDKDNGRMSVERQKRFDNLIIQGTKVSGVSDIIISVADEPYPIICELKREKKGGYGSPNVQEVGGQIYKYRKGISRDYAKERKAKIGNLFDIKAYFICGEHILEKYDLEDIKYLENQAIRVLTYQEIIRMIYAIYNKALNE